MREAGKFSQPRLRQVALPKIDEIDSIQAKPVNLPREEERNVSPGPARDLIGSLIRGEPAPRPPGRIPDKTPALSKPRIEAAQRALVKLGHRLDVDGLTGPATLAAVEAFQSAHRLPATGTLDARTINALATKSRIRIP
ncbi:MAG: peptidoglycan-binding domain-containing protein [Beijerinckiaceae bacterium]